MAENVYEGMFILDTHRYGRDAEAVSGQIPKTIEKAGGEILVSRLWEERRLAFPIKGHRKGTYWLSYFRLDSNRLADIRRDCQLSDSILRVLFLKVDPRIVETLVAHAQAGHIGRAGRDERVPGEKGKLDEAKAVAVAEGRKPEKSEPGGKEEA